MKAFLVILIVLNIAVFAGYSYLKPSPQSNVVSQTTTAPSLMLADERSNTLNKPRKSENQQMPAQAVAGPASYCQQIAPIFGLVAVDELVEWLDQKRVAHNVEEKEFEEISNYWVYIPALPSIDQARVILKQLRNAGVDDVYVIEAGPNRNAISLGLYRDKDAAEGRVAALAELGIEVQIQSRTRKVKGYQMLVGPESRVEIEGLIEHLDKHYPSLKSEEIACE